MKLKFEQIVSMRPSHFPSSSSEMPCSSSSCARAPRPTSSVSHEGLEQILRRHSLFGNTTARMHTTSSVNSSASVGFSALIWIERVSRLQPKETESTYLAPQREQIFPANCLNARVAVTHRYVDKVLLSDHGDSALGLEHRAVYLLDIRIQSDV